MWQSVPKDSATFSFPWILLCNLMPGLGVTGPQAETHRPRRWWLVLLNCFACLQMCTFSSLADRDNQVEGSHTVASDTRGGLHYSKERGCMRTNNTNVHAQMLRVWSRADRSPETAYVNCFDCPVPCASSTIYVGGQRPRDNRFVVKAIRRVTKAASSNSDCEKDSSGHTHLQTVVIFFKSKPQVVVYGLVLWSNWAAAKLRPVDGAKHNSSLFVFLIPSCSETIQSLPIILSRRSLWAGRQMRDRLVVIRSILRLSWPISAAQSRPGAADLTERRTGTLINILFVRLSDQSGMDLDKRLLRSLFNCNGKWKKSFKNVMWYSLGPIKNKGHVLESP